MLVGVLASAVKPRVFKLIRRPACDHLRSRVATSLKATDRQQPKQFLCSTVRCPALAMASDRPSVSEEVRRLMARARAEGREQDVLQVIQQSFSSSQDVQSMTDASKRQRGDLRGDRLRNGSWPRKLPTRLPDKATDRKVQWFPKLLELPLVLPLVEAREVFRMGSLRWSNGALLCASCRR